MFWIYCAYALFMLGSALGIIENGSELSVWFIGLGWFLDLTLVLLILLKSTILPRPKPTRSGLVTHIFVLLTIPILLFYRALPNLPVFKLLLLLCVVLWSYSLAGLNRAKSTFMEKS